MINDNMYDHYLSQDMGLTTPPLDEFSNYFAEGKVHGKNNISPEIVSFDIALLTLSKNYNLNDQKGLEYLAQFLSHFCPHNDHYSALSHPGKERVDSIRDSDSKFIKKAVRLSNCLS